MISDNEMHLEQSSRGHLGVRIGPRTLVRLASRERRSYQSVCQIYSFRRPLPQAGAAK